MWLQIHLPWDLWNGSSRQVKASTLQPASRSKSQPVVKVPQEEGCCLVWKFSDSLINPIPLCNIKHPTMCFYPPTRHGFWGSFLYLGAWDSLSFQQLFQTATLVWKLLNSPLTQCWIDYWVCFQMNIGQWQKNTHHFRSIGRWTSDGSIQIFFSEGHWFQFLNNPTLISPTHFHQIGELYVHIIAHIYIFYTLINRPLNWIDISCSAKHYNVQISLTTSIWFFNIPIICGYSRFDWPSKVTATIMNHDQLWSIIVNHQKPW